MHSTIQKSFLSSKSPSPLNIYQNVFIELATKYSKHKKRFLSNTGNWGKRSGSLKKEDHNKLISSKRIWQEQPRPENDALYPQKDDVIRTRIFLNPRTHKYIKYKKLFYKFGIREYAPWGFIHLDKRVSHSQGKVKRRIGMIQKSPMFDPAEEDEYG